MQVKFKKSSLKSVSIIFFVVCILFITGSLAVVIDEKVKVDTAIKYDNKVKTNNSFFELLWDFDVTGYGADGRFYLKSSNFKSLDKNRTVYIGLITPSLINNNNEVSITQSKNIKNVVTNSFFCDTNKHGWEVFNQEIWCNSTFSKINNITFINESYDIKTLYTVTSDNNLVDNVNNLTVFYNITTFSKQNIKTDLSVSFIKIEQKNIKTYLKKLDKDFTDLGNNIALINIPINLTENQVNILELKLDVPKNILPMKYSVVIIDADDNSYIVLDPTIVNARTWSTNNDFTNGTVLTNLTSSASGITLTTGTNTLFTTTTNGSYSVDTQDTLELGQIINISQTFILSNFSFASSWGGNKCKIYQASGTELIASGTVSGLNCIFSTPITLNASNYYRIVGGGTGSWDSRSTGVVTLPQQETYFAWGYSTYGSANSVTTNQTNVFRSVERLSATISSGTTKTTGTYSDRQGWIPQTNNQITNLSVTVDNSSGGNIRFRYNITNSSLDTSDWTVLTNGTQLLTLNLGANSSIFYQYDFNGTGTGKVSSYIISETSISQGGGATSSCTYVSGVWTIQGSELCGLNTTSLGGQNIIFNGTGQTRILQSITNCGTITLQNGVDVTVTSGARLC